MSRTQVPNLTLPATVSMPLRESPVLELSPPPVVDRAYQPEPLEALSPMPGRRRSDSIFSKVSRVSRNFTDKVANFHQKNPMIMMVIIAVIVALLAPQLLPLLL